MTSTLPTHQAAGDESADLSRLFEPRSVAIVGASDDRDSAQGRLFHRIRGRFEALGTRIYPVSRSRDSVGGLPAVRSLSAIPEPIDVAILFVGDVPAALADAVENEVGFVIAFSGGFAEAGAEGAERQRQLAQLLAQSRTRLLGPNTTLVLYESLRQDITGPALGVVAQSGAQGQFLIQGQELGIPVKRWLATGNEADLDVADAIFYYADDAEIGAIAVYAEGFHDGRRLVRSARHAADRGTPVVMVKVGRTEAGGRAAIAHTGHLAGSDEVMSAVLRQLGIQRVDELEELLDASALIARAEAPQGKGVCVYGTSGGSTAHMMDLLLEAGIPMATLSEETTTALRQWIPSEQSIDNPVDIGRAVLGPHTGDMLATIAADPAVSAVVMALTQTRTVHATADFVGDRLAHDAEALAGRTETPLLAVWTSYPADEPGHQALRDSDAFVFRTFRSCVAAVRSWYAYHDRRDQLLQEETSPPATSATVVTEARSRLGQRRGLTEFEANQVLSTYGVSVPRQAVAQSAAQARALAAEIGFPLVAKISSPDIAHKSDLGLVDLQIRSESEAAKAYERLLVRAEEQAPGRAVDGVLFSERVGRGTETVLGITRDPTFGPVVMFGLGGIFVEALRDVTFRVPPFSHAEARRMISEVRGAVLLDGYRGAPPADLDALAGAIVSVGQLAHDLEDLVLELDINPLMAGAEGAVALDALLVTVTGAGR